MYRRSQDDWANLIEDLLDAARDDGYAVYIKQEGDDMNLYIGCQMHDFGDEDLYITELGI